VKQFLFKKHNKLLLSLIILISLLLIVTYSIVKVKQDTKVTTERSKTIIKGEGEEKKVMETIGDQAKMSEFVITNELKVPSVMGSNNFKVIGYFPNWAGDVIDEMKWDKLTHVNYAFAIPTKDGEIRDLEDKSQVEKLIKTAHEYNVKVGLSVGGWSYNDELLEGTFVQATNTEAKCQLLAENILTCVDDYGFDGVDMDWEYPREGISAKQYEYFMTFLRQGLTTRNKYLTAAVVGNGTTGYGQTDYVLDMLDWINVMAYDGDEGPGHSPFSYAVSCGEFWINTRGVKPNKVVLGVPFYERPGWSSYSDIVANDLSASTIDSTLYNGKTIYYNGLPTIEKKTNWACENAGGIMIWEITEDSKDEKLSLLNQISITTKEYFPDYKEK
jgi:GH18 family chitinase